MNSPRLQPGDHKVPIFRSAPRRPKDGEGREKRGGSFLSPGLKAGAIHQFNIVELRISLTLGTLGTLNS
jgi:hypothetical protein